MNLESWAGMFESVLQTLDQLFRHPAVLLLLGLVPTIALWILRRSRKRRQELVAFTGGHPLAMLAPDRRRPLILGLAALTLTILGAAGPQLGRSPQEAGGAGRDLLIVLDVSQSMLAEDASSRSRLARARQAIRDLLATLEGRGGQRAGLIIFAGQAQVSCHLTEDLEACRHSLDLAHPDRLGIGGRIGFRQGGEGVGTSLREALELALATHDPRFRGFQDILLVSDGDDLAGDWQTGAAKAGTAGLAVHVFGVGDPGQSSPIPTRRPEQPYLLQAGGENGSSPRVTTRRHDEVLQTIAQETDGTFLTEDASIQPLVKWYQKQIAGLPVRNWGEDPHPLPTQQFGWFYLGALILMFAALVLVPRPRAGPVSGP